ASSPTIVTPAAPCSALIPAPWTEPVPSAALPPAESNERDWMVFGVAQTGQLRTANGRTADVIGIVTACEARDAAAARQIERPWWKSGQGRPVQARPFWSTRQLLHLSASDDPISKATHNGVWPH